MQTAGDLVRVLIELPTGMEYGKDDLKSALAILRHEIDRDTPAIIIDRDRTVPVDDHQDPIAEPGKSLIHSIVHDLVDQVMQPPGIRTADVHGGTFPHRSQAFQYRNMRSIVSISHL